LYQILFNQITLINAREYHPMYLIIPLEIMALLIRIVYQRFSECNDMVINDIKQEHFNALKKLSQLHKEYSDAAPNELDIMVKGYVYQINEHVLKTRLIGEGMSIILILVNVLSVTLINPLQFLAILYCIELVAADMNHFVLSESDAGNLAAKRHEDQVEFSANEFVRNTNIIYECIEEQQYFETITQHIDQFMNIRKSISQGQKMNKPLTEFEIRFQEKVLLLTWIIPKNGMLAWIYTDLKTICNRLSVSLTAYNDNHAKLKQLQMERLASTPAARATSEPIPINIAGLNGRILFAIEPVQYTIENKTLFHVRRVLHIPSKKWVTMLGKSGSGKTTLINLCLKSIKHSTANIRFLGRYHQYTYDDIRRYVSNVKPNADLFERSILFNLTFGVKNASDPRTMERIGEYMERFGIGALFEKLDENISQLSTGEKQRIKLIRCILHDKPIWVLDEATANLDKDCELCVLSILKELQTTHGKSVIHITHNEALTKFSNRIITIENKTVVIKKTPKGTRR